MSAVDRLHALPEDRRYTYWLKASWQDEYTQVTKEDFIRAERGAGFHPKGGDGLATAGFSSTAGASGQVRNTPELDAILDEYRAERANNG